MQSAFYDFAPNLLDLTKASLENSKEDLGFLRLDAVSWEKLDNISIDYAIMEKAKNLVAIPYTSKWSDLGDWDAIWSDSGQDSFGNVQSNHAHAMTVVIVCSVLKAKVRN